MDEPSHAELATLNEWVTLSEALTRGLLHALNNRITALGAFAELAAMGDDEFTPERVLPDELARLQKVNGLFRLLLSEDAGPEPLQLDPILDDVLALQVHHPLLRSLRVNLDQRQPLQPVRVPRWSLIRLLLLFLQAAKQSADARKLDAASLSLSSDEQAVTLRARTDGVPMGYATAMAGRCGGELTTRGGESTLRLPTLLALRTRERADR